MTEDERASQTSEFYLTMPRLMFREYIMDIYGCFFLPFWNSYQLILWTSQINRVDALVQRSYWYYFLLRKFAWTVRLACLTIMFQCQNLFSYELYKMKRTFVKRKRMEKSCPVLIRDAVLAFAWKHIGKRQ